LNIIKNNLEHDQELSHLFVSTERAKLDELTDRDEVGIKRSEEESYLSQKE
jgi:hypothetical protein